MNFINMLSWWQWGMLAAVPPALVLLYFLKFKRQPLEVPSTYLWHQSIEDLHVNSIWQRLRRNILLLLQLLLVLLAILALVRPSWQSTALTGERFIFLIDNSASMSATDVTPTRLEEAKRKVLALVDQMSSGDQSLLISFSDTAQVVHEFTANRQALRRRIQSIEPTQKGTSLLAALKLAGGLAGSLVTSGNDQEQAAAPASLPADVYIVSDGRFPAVQGFSLKNLRPIFITVGTGAAANVAITAFSTERHPTKPTEAQAYCELQNFGPDSVRCEVELYRDDQLADARQVEIAGTKATENRPNNRAGVQFDLGETISGDFRVEIKPDDALPIDNVAYATLNVPRRSRVLLVTPGNEVLSWAISTQRAVELSEVSTAGPEILATEAHQRKAASGAYDLVIYDRCAPAQMPQANTFFIGHLPPTPGWLGERPVAEVPQILDAQRAHPLLQLVELGDIEIGQCLVFTPPAGASTLVDSNAGPLLALAARDGFEDAVLGFELASVDAQGQTYLNTNWPLRLSFPTFMLGVLEYLGGQAQPYQAVGASPGEAVEIKPASAVDRLQVTPPVGKTKTIVRNQHGTFVYRDTDHAGIYRVREARTNTQRFAVNLFDSNESNLVPSPQLQIGYVEVEGQADWEPARGETWKLLLGLGLVVLVLEWYIYNRRLYF